MRAALFGALFLFACTEGALLDGRDERPIIGGLPSTAGEYPETGVLLSVYDFGGGQQFGSMTCTGTLIAPDVVMMAAHCTIDFSGGSVPVTNYFSFALDVSEFGMESLVLPPDAIEIEELVPHPMFDIDTAPPTGLSNYNDVGLGFLKEKFEGVVPGVVADAQDAATLAVDTEVVIVGYGQTSATAMQAGVKHQAISFINEIGPHEMQIGDVPPGDPQKCHGDSGGPTFVDIDDGRAPLRRVIGITSRAYDESDCNKGGVDMRADAFRDWFDQTMRDRCSAGLRPAEVCTNGGGLPLPGGMIPPPPDAGFADTGFMDSGAEDAGTVEEDAGVEKDAAVTPNDSGASSADAAARPGGSGRPRDRGCGCAATERQGERAGWWWVLLLIAGCAQRVRRGSGRGCGSPARCPPAAGPASPPGSTRGRCRAC